MMTTHKHLFWKQTRKTQQLEIEPPQTYIDIINEKEVEFSCRHQGSHGGSPQEP